MKHTTDGTDDHFRDTNQSPSFCRGQQTPPRKPGWPRCRSTHANVKSITLPLDAPLGCRASILHREHLQMSVGTNNKWPSFYGHRSDGQTYCGWYRLAACGLVCAAHFGTRLQSMLADGRATPRSTEGGLALHQNGARVTSQIVLGPKCKNTVGKSKAFSCCHKCRHSYASYLSFWENVLESSRVSVPSLSRLLWWGEGHLL